MEHTKPELYNQTTQKLESYGRARGLDLNICKMIGRKDGLFFIVRQDRKVYKQPKSMGHSIMEAELWIEDNKPATQGVV